jgi:hypothetical protein
MSAITNVWRQLVQRRLWPVAIVLIAALAAVPLTLAKQPEPAAPAPSPAPAADADSQDALLAAEPIVAKGAAVDTTKGHKVVGKAKNPFGVAKPAGSGSDAAPNSKGSVVAKTRTGSDETPSSGSGSGGGTPSTGTTPSTPAAPVAPATPAEPAPKPKTYAPQELTIRFGSEEGKRQSLKRLQALPSEDNPVLIYLGLLKDGKTAEFMVGDGVTPVGDGECRPSAEECETVRLRAGETEFFDVADATGTVTEQFQLDLIKVHRGGSASASKAKAKASLKAAVRLLHGDAGLRSTVGQTTARLP